MASSTPATSSKVTRPCASVSSFALDLPNPMALPPAPCICRDMNIHTPMKASSGNPLTSSVTSQELPSDGALAVICTFFL